jgi:hypothetical protein
MFGHDLRFSQWLCAFTLFISRTQENFNLVFWSDIKALAM